MWEYTQYGAKYVDEIRKSEGKKNSSFNNLN